MTLSELEIGAIIATLVRAAGLAATVPVIGDVDVPIRARLIFVVAIGIGVGINRPGVAYVELPPVVLIELAMGLLTGVCARFVMARIAVAGQLVGLSLGLGFAAEYDARAGESASTVRMLFTALGGLAFLSVGGLEAIVQSASSSPAHISDVALLGPELLRQGAAAFGHGLALAGPIVLAALISHIGLAIMNRAAPAINVFSLSLSAILILGGLVLVATAGNLVGSITDTANRAIVELSP